MTGTQLLFVVFLVCLALVLVWVGREFIRARREEEEHREIEPGEGDVSSALQEAKPKAEVEPAAEAKPKAEVEPAVEAKPKAEVEPAVEAVVRQPVPKPAPPVAKVAQVKKGKSLAEGLSKTRKGFVARLGRLFRGKQTLDDDLVDQIEEVLFTADLGVRTSEMLLDKLKNELDGKSLKDPGAVWAFIKEEARRILSVPTDPWDLNAHKPFVILTIGVNGVGKTTTIGKLAAKLSEQGKSVLLAAGDTFRAAAVEQLEVWGDKVGAKVVRGKENADPSSVIFDGIKKALADGVDVVIADTAGRLHTKVDLMDELKKVHRVMGKALEGAPHETLLILDATTGQNAIQQARLFQQAVSFTGVVLTKMDGTAKGGVILGVCDELKVPVRFVGIGERVEDLREFDPGQFVEALFRQEDDPV